ncbi:PAS domain-containing methyl-accepting chemotaxis protein [Thalassobaculum sp.]|uniref:methyl-accepting chemotaxis protein n=1 Tax=Thalassobaculum sp. TaxID=2022740 RepID=UPI0032EC091D
MQWRVAVFGFSASNRYKDLAAKVEAMERSQAVIEFDLNGTIISANANFLNAMGYTLVEIQGKHHSLFVDPTEREGAEYRAFWDSLRRGEFQSREFRRLGKGGREVWIQAAYNPVMGRDGKPTKVVKVATDVTERVQRDADSSGQIAAIGKSQAVIEFNLDGTILTANENFLNAIGYELAEIQGKHHSMFVTPVDRDSQGYQAFWAALRRGEYQTAEYKRIGKGGREIWIQASYNPIFDRNGKPFKVVKFATDVTADKLRNADTAGQLAAISKSQAVIEFDLDGTIRMANENFLGAMGYELSDVQDKHHRMFVTSADRDSQEYQAFWAMLRRGEYQAAEYKRIAKGGREVWIQASYNPILDLNGNPFKVVKYATDVTEQVIARKRAEHVQQLLETVAAGSEQLNASVREIAGSMVKSKNTTSEAFDLVMEADRATQQLTEATKSMGGIVEVINNITSQINLLALNATIESARAGEAGKGFAVVANEVKNLAGQAKGATEQISENIDGMRTISNDVVGSLSAIRGAMQQVLDYVTSTASAVEEQSAVADDMSSNMQQAATAASRIGTA